MTGARPILTADDFALSEGVSAGIEALARARRISAAGAMVTMPRWPEHAPRLAALRGDIAIGLHLNLTLGAPLGAMPSLAPDGRLPAIATLVSRALARRLDRAEIAAEITRQFGQFAAATGYPPDFIDGHQHVHALPVVRDALIDALATGPAAVRPLVRNPADTARRISSRGLYPAKSLMLAGLARGFGRLLARHGWPTNDSFSGVSAFERASPYAAELARALRAPGRRHLVMCHPGIPDAELAALDPVVERRRDELDALSAFAGLPDLIWHPARAPDGPLIDWGTP